MQERPNKTGLKPLSLDLQLLAGVWELGWELLYTDIKLNLNGKQEWLTLPELFFTNTVV